MSKPINIKIEKSSKSDKKLMAIFTLDNGRTKTVHFGAAGYEDYTIHKNEDRKNRYIERHKRHENWDDPMTPGALSRYILWNKKTISDSLVDFMGKFNLKP